MRITIHTSIVHLKKKNICEHILRTEIQANCQIILLKLYKITQS